MLTTILGWTAVAATFGWLLVRQLEYRDLSRAEANERLRKLLEKK